MPKQATKAEVNNFVGGLVTEASPLNFPPNSSLDEENYELTRKGTRQRRLGFDLEQSNVWRAASTTQDNPVTFKWGDAGGVSGKSLLVLQLGNVLSFFDLSKDNLSSDGFISSLTLTELPNNVDFSMSSVDGKLIVASGISKLAVVEYDGTSFSYKLDTLKTRDVWGVQTTGTEGAKYENDPKYRGAFTDLHRYNLQNQSWGIPRKNASDTLQDPVLIYFNEHGVYPSNSETVWPGLQFQPVTSGTPFERVYPSLYLDVLGSDTKAAKGYFIIDVVNRGTSRAQAVADNNSRHVGSLVEYVAPTAPDYTEGGCSVVAEFAGRVFYGGFSGKTIGGDSRSPTLTNYVFFSHVIKSTPDFFKCYQEGDPTSRDNNEIVDTDGGFIRLAGADRIIGMVASGEALIVICSNGVWAITGGSDYGFTATTYKADRISTFGALSSRSIVVEQERVYYWSEEGINLVAKNQLGEYEVGSITSKNIKTLYQNIPLTERAKAIGSYDVIDKKVRWIYQKDGYVNELILDLVLQAFYKHRIMNLTGYDVKVVGVFNTSIFNSVSNNEEVYSGSDLVLSSADEVVAPVTSVQSNFVSIKYLCVGTISATKQYSFGYYRNTDFRDWQRLNGVGEDAKAYLITGAQIAGDSSIQKQVQYLTMHFERTEEGVDSNLSPLKQSSCYGRMQWDWSYGSLSNKWSALRQMYRYVKQYTPSGPSDTYDTGFEVITTKNLIRGRGRAFALYLETEPYKDCKVLGWSVSVDGNSKV